MLQQKVQPTTRSKEDSVATWKESVAIQSSVSTIHLYLFSLILHYTVFMYGIFAGIGSLQGDVLGFQTSLLGPMTRISSFSIYN